MPPVHTKCGSFHAAENSHQNELLAALITEEMPPTYTQSGGKAALGSELVTEARAVSTTTGRGVVRTVVRVTILLFTLVRQVDAFDGEFQVF